MGTPMAMVNIVSLLASAVTYLSTPVIYNMTQQLAYPMWTTFAFCFFALVCGMMAGAVTIYGEKHALISVNFENLS